MVLEQSDMMATVLAHEIKNPVALAMAYVGLLRHASEPTEVINYCNRIQQSLMDISDLVQDLLLAAQTLETEHVASCKGTARNKPEPCDISITDMLTEMLDEYRAAFCSRPGIVFALSAELGLVCHTYEQHLRLVFSNLLKNAAEATGEAGYITVYAAMHGEYLRVQICNSLGVAQAKPHGNGMGLGICHWLLKQLGGQLQIENRAGECIAIVSVPAVFRQDKK